MGIGLVSVCHFPENGVSSTYHLSRHLSSHLHSKDGLDVSRVGPAPDHDVNDVQAVHQVDAADVYELGGELKSGRLRDEEAFLLDRAL